MKNWILRISICIAIGGLIGWFWHREYTKPRKSVSDCPAEALVGQEIEFESIWKRDYRIRHIQDVLYDYERGIVSIPQQGVWELKDELHRLIDERKPVKIYTGKWSKEGYLEVK